MFHIIEVGKREFPDFNKRVHYEDDGHEYCDKRGIYVHETTLTNEYGEYVHCDERPVIILHKFLDRRQKNWVFFHEIGHDTSHDAVPCAFTVDRRKKIETEANTIAAILMIPKELLIFLTDLEIEAEFNYPRKLIQFRRYLFNTYGE